MSMTSERTSSDQNYFLCLSKLVIPCCSMLFNRVYMNSYNDLLYTYSSCGTHICFIYYEHYVVISYISLHLVHDLAITTLFDILAV